MPKTLSPGVLILTTALLPAAGCAEPRDDHLADLARQTLHEQSQQNKRLAEQSQQIAEASQHLVEGDALARRELLEAQKHLSSELHAERVNLDRQREEIEEERRHIAAQRRRDPVIARAIGAAGLTLACLLPLLLAAYVIYTLNRTGDESEALSEMLITEIASNQPKLLPLSVQPVARIENVPPSPDGSAESGAPALDAE